MEPIKKKQTVLTKFFSQVRDGPEETVAHNAATSTRSNPEIFLELPNQPSTELTIETASKHDSQVPSDISQHKDEKPYQPKLSSYPCTMQGKQGRRFSKNWFEKYPLLEYSVQQDKVYCFRCRHFSSDIKTSFITGYSDWKHMDKLFEKHFLSENSPHQFAFQKYVMYQQSKQTGSVTTQINLHHKANVKRNCEVLCASVEVILLCAKQEIALRAHRDHGEDDNNGNFSTILELITRKSPDLAKQIAQMPGHATYTSHRIQNEILSVSGNLIRRMIMDEVKDTFDWYSIICDECKDSASKEQLSFCIRYVFESKIKERFVAYNRLQEFDADAILEAISQVIKNVGLVPVRCVSQAYDGASVMSGINKGVQKKFETKVGGKCPYIHCYAHRLNLVLVDSCTTIRDVRDTLGLLQAVYNFQSNSVLRNEVFQKAQREQGYSSILKMPQSCDTRWSSKIKGIKYFRNRFDSTLTALEFIVENGKPDEPAECRGYVFQLRTFKTVFLLCCMDEVLSITNQLSEYLQCSELQITRAIALCKGTIDTLVEMRSDEKFQELWISAEEIATNSEVSIADDSSYPKIARRKSLSSRLKDSLVTTTLGSRETDARTTKDKLRATFFQIIDTFSQEMKRRFLDNQDIAAGISAGNPQADNFMKFDDITGFCKLYARFGFDLDIIKSQIPVARNLIKSEKLDSVLQCYSYLQKMGPSFNELIKYYQIILCIPVSTATAERSFSALKRIKTPQRSSSGDERTSDLAIISSELYHNPQIVVDEFAKVSKRRLEFSL